MILMKAKQSKLEMYRSALLEILQGKDKLKKGRYKKGNSVGLFMFIYMEVTVLTLPQSF